tara:strand:- start:432 stop:668 length:237 start_codon:yes stop_codon:yes gene_type:complete
MYQQKTYNDPSGTFDRVSQDYLDISHERKRKFLDIKKRLSELKYRQERLEEEINAINIVIIGLERQMSSDLFVRQLSL